MRTPALLLVTLLLAAPAPAQLPKPGERETLQQFLERLRQMRDGVQTQLATQVDQVLSDMEMEAQVRRISGLEEQRDKLIALGAEAAPLLVKRLDPGASGTDGQKLLAQYVALALAARPSRSITDALLEHLRTGTTDGRRNALVVLATTPEPERVAPLIGQFFAQAQGAVRKDALTALVRIGGPEAEKVLVGALSDPSAEIVRFALSALAEARGVAHAPKVLKLAQATREAAGYVDGLFAYYKACPEAVGKPVLIAFLRIVEDLAAPRDLRIKVLAELAAFGAEFDSELRKELRVVAQSPERELKEAALILLHQTGDRNAKKELLADYDEQIERNKTWSNSYEQRAGILYRLAEYKDAQRDYQQALSLAKNDLSARLDEAYVGLARCYMQQNKLKEAAQTLERAPISLKRLADLAKEPLFKKLADNPKYRDVFKIN